MMPVLLAAQDVRNVVCGSYNYFAVAFHLVKEAKKQPTEKPYEDPLRYC